MTLIATFDRQRCSTKMNKLTVSRWLVLRCDTCDKLFLRKHCVSAAYKRKFHSCSIVCARRSKYEKEAAKATSILRYGVEHPMKSKVYIQKMRKSWLNLYGVDHPRKSEIVKKKIKEKSIQTMQSRFGVDYAFQSTEIQQKIIDSNIKKWGVVNHTQRLDAMKHIKNYGDITRIIHWKTHEVLLCRASYEVAFVNWCNLNQIDFDWQIRFKTPFKTKKNNDSFYFVDAYIKTGIHSNTFIEIKGLWRGTIPKLKWEWFNSKYQNSELWDKIRLRELGILNDRYKFSNTTN